jgi:hypothetical protein
MSPDIGRTVEPLTQSTADVRKKVTWWTKKDLEQHLCIAASTWANSKYAFHGYLAAGS